MPVRALIKSNMIKNSINKFMLKTILFLSLVFISLSIISVIVVNYYFHEYFISTTKVSLKSSINETYLEEFAIGKIPSIIESLSISLDFVHDILNGLSQPNNIQAVEKLSLIKKHFDLEAVFVMNDKGTVVLCTPYGLHNEKTLYGENFSSKQYFKEALKGHIAIYPEIRATFFERNLYFASPVISKSGVREVIGVIVIKIDPKFFDAYFEKKFLSPTFLLSPSGVVFASNRSDWIFKTVKTMSQEDKNGSHKKSQLTEIINITNIPFYEDSFEYYGTRYDVIRVSFPSFRDSIGNWEIVSVERYPVETRFLLDLAVVVLIFICCLGLFFFILQRDTLKEKRLAEERILMAMKRTEQLYRVIPSAIFCVDENKNITTWNNMAAEITGYSAEEVIGNSCALLALDTCKEGCLLYKEEMPKPITGRICEIASKDGRILMISKSVDILYDADGGIIGGIECFEDITEKHQAELELIETKDKALVATKAKSAFLANMSHEIRTPMNAILGFAQILERDPNLTPGQAKFVQIINRSGNHLLKLINDVLDMSKIETGSSVLNKTTFSFYNMIRDIEIIFKSHAEGKGLSLFMSYEDDVPEFITADEGKLRQIFINILGNAIKFTESGNVAFRIGVANLSTQPVSYDDLINIIVEIEDSGLGIPEEDIMNIFEPFSQSAAGFKIGGTGLGLPLAKNFIELMGGDISVKSEVNVGTCFKLIIPVEIGEDNTKVEQTEKPNKVVGIKDITSPIRILVVDDIELNRVLLLAILEPIGFEVREAENGQQAIEIFREWSPHVVLMDMRMPVMDGYEAIRLIKSDEVGKKTTVISVTASAFEDNKDEVLATGTNDYLRKPFREYELLSMLSKHIGVQYIYEETMDDVPEVDKEINIKNNDLKDLPKEMVQEILSSVEGGDIAKLKELLNGLWKTNKDAADRLRVLADSYDYEKIQELLQ